MIVEIKKGFLNDRRVDAETTSGTGLFAPRGLRVFLQRTAIDIYLQETHQ